MAQRKYLEKSRWLTLHHREKCAAVAWSSITDGCVPTLSPALVLGDGLMLSYCVFRKGLSTEPCGGPVRMERARDGAVPRHTPAAEEIDGSDLDSSCAIWN